MNSTTCCACAAKFGKREEGNPCTICEKVFCASCCALKSKLELTVSRQVRRSCVCQRLIKLKKSITTTSHEASNASEKLLEQSDLVTLALKKDNNKTSDKCNLQTEYKYISNSRVTSPLNTYVPLNGSPVKLTTTSLHNRNFTPIMTDKRIAPKSTFRVDEFNAGNRKLTSQSNWETKQVASTSIFKTRKFESQSASENVQMIANKGVNSELHIGHSRVDESTKKIGFPERLDYDDLVAKNLIELAQMKTTRGHQNMSSDGLWRYDEPEVETDLFNNDGLDMEAIPAFDDIPLALLLSKAFNEKELQIAHEKQRQENILSFIQRRRLPEGTYHNNDDRWAHFDDEPPKQVRKNDEHHE
ncbi:hypothetical protein DPMN_046345 [Dreissena polymorpha]|uniref:Uncharacterized protein n=1 Tax=Dreissena polymorpha TaxID=45954 RepID=A0A9D4I0G9_DREPO|nr:hypothetical protein DPMN_046345 [Dreissena polymorpha]